MDKTPEVGRAEVWIDGEYQGRQEAVEKLQVNEEGMVLMVWIQLMPNLPFCFCSQEWRDETSHAYSLRNLYL